MVGNHEERIGGSDDPVLGHEGRLAGAEAGSECRPHVAKIADRARAVGTGALGGRSSARRDRGGASDPRSRSRRRHRAPRAVHRAPHRRGCGRAGRRVAGPADPSDRRVGRSDRRGAPRWPRLRLGAEIAERCDTEIGIAQDPRISGREGRSGGPVGLRLRLAEKVIQRRLVLALGLRELLLQAIRLEIARRLEHLLERLPGASLQADPQRGQHRGLAVRQALGDLDLGQGLLCLGQELLIVHGDSLPRSRPAPVLGSERCPISRAFSPA